MLSKRAGLAAFAVLLTGIAVAVFGWQRASDDAKPPSTDRVSAEAESMQPVNAVLGDASYIARFGHRPGPGASETVRLKTHLAYVEQLLRARPTPHLSPEQRTARARHLDRLRDYWTRGEFPQNPNPAIGRQPTFIDQNGRICAVGYLVAESAGWDVAQRINAEYKHAYIPEIAAPVLDEWAASAGFTERELAMIQPQYGDDGCVACVVEDENNEVHRGAEIGVMALNAGAVVLNGVMSANNRRSYVASGAGLALGATGLALGLSDGAHYTTGDAVLAGASILMSTWSLTAPIERRTSSKSAKKMIPDTHLAALPVRGETPKVGVSLEWTF